MGVQDLERDGLIRPAEGAYPVDGVEPRFLARPRSVDEASQVLRAAAAEGLAVGFMGSGSKLGLGNPPERLDLLVETGALDQVLEHAAGDLVVRAQAGVRLADLQAALAPAGQQLALDPPEPRATLGGVVAANASGPRRLRYGTVRDLLIGITVVLADGTVARAGGKVVKNVAGYDLAKLFCGSLGTLGMVAEVIFRLHPAPAAASVVTLGVEGPGQAGQAVLALQRSTLEPSAVELTVDEWGWPGRLTVVFEGIQPGVEAQAAAAAELLGRVGEAATAGPGQTEAALSQLGALPFEKAEYALKATFPPAQLAGALADLLGGRQGWGGGPVSAHAATGVLWMASGLREGDLPPDSPTFPRAARSIREARERLAARGGRLVLVKGSPELKRAVDVWGPPGDAAGLMRRVKERFDPDRRLSPGRFVGGI
ncbi:MAG TPA: FAD-binding oxidoreductase [Actinomycetota bacterium]|jgi:glycolate oxidase FAD binding subunit|nr:FAD-binding oxidoreductase [Actinomycetota bacterium]